MRLIRRVLMNPWTVRAAMVGAIGFDAFTVATTHSADPLMGWLRVADVAMLVLMSVALIVVERRRAAWQREREQMIADARNPAQFRASLDYFHARPLRDTLQVVEWEAQRDPAVPRDEALMDAPPVVRDYYAAMAPYENNN